MFKDELSQIIEDIFWIVGVVLAHIDFRVRVSTIDPYFWVGWQLLLLIDLVQIVFYLFGTSFIFYGIGGWSSTRRYKIRKFTKVIRLDFDLVNVVK